ncbi:MAG: hypothetical protein GX326_04245 [Clostridiaceae bacterium]|nr:hypothetical protein [Clostridiaceae bacterium]
MKGSKTRQVFNSLNLLEKVVLPEETVWENGRSLQVIPEQSYEYNKAGHKIAEIISLPNGKKQRIDFDVDGLGRVIKETSLNTFRFSLFYSCFLSIPLYFVLPFIAQPLEIALS